jgi:metacaspase-1
VTSDEKTREHREPVKRALLIGINEYPDKENILTACLNDVTDVAEFLVNQCQFRYDDIRLLTERRATRAEIWKRLEWLVKGLKAGDQIVFFYSGHGNRLATRNVDGHVDKYYECICPYDFDWEGKNNISDRDFHEIFSRMPRGAKLIWISDSCYSGGLSELEQELGHPGRRDSRGRTIALPLDISWRVQTAIKSNLQLLKMSGVVESNDIVLISGTKERQQAQEKAFQKELKINGLMTYFLLEELRRADGLDTPLKIVMEKVIQSVKSYAEASKPTFRQEPTIHGRTELLDRGFLK